MTVALLTAAGSGTRMGQAIPKQFLHVNDKPIIVYTMERFQQNAQVDAIAVVTLPAWAEFIRTYARQFGITKLELVVSGGETGQESIRNGLNAIAEKYQDGDVVVMIHDGNRPMISDTIISDSLRVFQEKGNAVAVIPCTEVVFNCQNGKEATKEIPREELWRTQTPHTFTLQKLLWACEQAQQKGMTGMAAMCQLMARLGETLYFSKGSEKNLKLTTMDDMDIFKSLLNTEKSVWSRG